MKLLVVGSSGKGLSLGGYAPSRSKVQILFELKQFLEAIGMGEFYLELPEAFAGNSLLRACAPPGLVEILSTDILCQ